VARVGATLNAAVYSSISPAGVDDGVNVRVTGEGEVSARGGTPGTRILYLPSSHTHSSNVSNDIIYELRINSTQKLYMVIRSKCPLIDGPLADLKIPPGTPGDTSFRLKGMASQSSI